MKDISFEKAFERLEEILEKMNKEKVSLDESLKLFEEANSLINICSTQLSNAEQKIEILLKGKNGELTLDKTGKPLTESFESKQTNSSSKNLSEEIPF
jgi:exodeoxyribonuclease VII small subunit